MVTTRRRKSSSRHGASRGYNSGLPASVWFLSGLLLGLALCGLALYKGYLPQLQQAQPAGVTPPPVTEAAPEPETESIAARNTDRRFDFFTVLPEMEVIVPEQELSRNALPPGDAQDSSTSASYILQVGSFRGAADADQMKARLALLGHVASVQMVTVNGETWHRVRIGPVEGARLADEKRRVLQDNGIETLVMKTSP